MEARRADSGPISTIDFPAPLELEHVGRDAWVTSVDERRLRLSNLKKVFWPEEGYTKGDILAYYLNAAPFMIRHLRERPLTLRRMPNGIAGDFFYEKRSPPNAPEWIARCEVLSSGDKGGLIDYLIADDAAAMLYVANLGCIEFHPLHSRCAEISSPDYVFFDLDPFEPYTYGDVLAVASHVRVVLDQLGLDSYPKTSGATGLQVFVPIQRGRFTYQETRDFAGRVGQMILEADPARVTMEWAVSQRAGKVFIDHNMNREGANIAAAYSVRPEPGATVSAPLTWDEVEQGDLRPCDFTMQNIFERLRATGDVFAPVQDGPYMDLAPALERLGIPRSEAAGTERSSDLEPYALRRDFGRTPEPEPESRTTVAPAVTRPRNTAGNSFVIQKHRATRLHYDLRLERDGALPSWAIPKGLPTTRGDRRMAVQTEVHPLEYGGFEGTIPEGNYGAGEVRIFDAGWYEVLEWTDEKVSFKLHGRRYPGLEFHLIKTRSDWLAILASDQNSDVPAEPPSYRPMLAEGGFQAFDDPGWWFEAKMDGIRCLARLSTGETVLRTRTGRDVSSRYPELRMIHEMVDQVNAVLDGEIVALDESGRVSFETLQGRMNLENERDVKLAAKKAPVSLLVFDLLWLDGKETCGLPLEERRRMLEAITEQDDGLRLMPYVEGRGIGFKERAADMGLEGVMAKKKGSKYLPGRRSPDWRKIKLVRSQDCVILGWTPGKGSRTASFGALLVGAWSRGRLRWIGQVGTGFTDDQIKHLMELLAHYNIDRAPIDDSQLSRARGAVFVRPELVCEVSYLEMTSAGKMRAPSFKGLRPDKTPEECVLGE